MTPDLETAPRADAGLASRTAACPGRPWLALLRWPGAGVLLLGEALVLTLSFDTTGTPPRGAGLILAHSSHLLRGALAVFFVTAALAAWRFPGELLRAARDAGPFRHFTPWLAAHLASFAAFWAVTDALLGSRGTAEPGWSAVLAWLALAVATAATAAALAVPLRLWAGLLRRGWPLLATGLVVGLAAGMAGQVSQLGWQALSYPTLRLAYQLVRLACPDALCEPDDLILGTPAFRVRVAASCSGLEGIGLILVYLTAYLVLVRRTARFPHALLLLPLGAAVAWLANVVRIAALVVVGDRVSPELALGGGHSQAGWLAFNAVALGLLCCAHRSRLFFREPAASRPVDGPTAAYLAPLMTLLAATMITTAVFTNPLAAYPLRVVATAAVLCFCWPAYAEPGGGKAGWRWLLWPALLGVGVFALWRLLEPLAPPGGPDPREALSGAPGWAVAGWVIFRAIGSVVVVPLAEEIAFRGYLLRRLVDPDFRSVSPGRFTTVSVLASSVLFGLLHGRWLAGSLAGLAYALALSRRGRLGDAVLAHAVTNGLLTAVALTTGNWRAWS
jgi:exosortase E/protease (VPEID-CTERM system)